MNDPDVSSAGIRSLEIGIGLFRRLHAFGRPIGLSELAAAAGLHPSKAHRYLASLVRAGLVARDARGVYGMGPFARELAAAARPDDDAFALARDRLRALGDALQDTVFVARWNERGPVVAHVVESDRAISMRPSSNGRELPLWNSATSRAFLAFMEPRAAQSLLEAESAAAIAGGATARDVAARARETAAQLAATRRYGIGRTTGERQAGLASLSAPIFDASGRVVLAVTLIGVAATVDARWRGGSATALRAFADAITRDGGGGRGGGRGDRRTGIA